MTPKEKAIELYEKFIFPCWECDEFAKAKECSLIAVDEILDDGNASSPFEEYRIMYWNEVKQEIELL